MLLIAGGECPETPHKSACVDVPKRPIAAAKIVAIHSCRFYSPRVVVRNPSLKLLEKFEVCCESDKRAVGHVELQTPVLLLRAWLLEP